MSEDDKKLPDSYVPNAYALPYASNLSSPVIKPDKLGGWKVGAVHSANKHFDERFEKLKQEFHNLANEFKEFKTDFFVATCGSICGDQKYFFIFL